MDCTCVEDNDIFTEIESFDGSFVSGDLVRLVDSSVAQLETVVVIGELSVLVSSPAPEVSVIGQDNGGVSRSLNVVNGDFLGLQPGVNLFNLSWELQELDERIAESSGWSISPHPDLVSRVGNCDGVVVSSGNLADALASQRFNLGWNSHIANISVSKRLICYIKLESYS